MRKNNNKINFGKKGHFTMKIRKNLIPVIALVGVLVFSLTMGTWAYFSMNMSVDNEFKTGKYGTKITEDFTPPDNWVPGVEIGKEVKVTNTGEVPVVVRASLAEIWASLVPGDGRTFPRTVTYMKESVSVTEEAALKAFGDQVIEKDDYDNIQDALAAATGKWLHVGNKNNSTDGWYYYIGIVEAEAETPLLLKSVTMNPILGNTVTDIVEEVFLDETGEKKVTTEITKSEFGYDDAQYKLTIFAETVQATADAITETFGSDAAAAYLAGLCL